MSAEPLDLESVLARLEEAERAVGRDWRQDKPGCCVYDNTHCVAHVVVDADGTEAEAELIVLARNALPLLIDVARAAADLTADYHVTAAAGRSVEVVVRSAAWGRFVDAVGVLSLASFGQPQDEPS